MKKRKLAAIALIVAGMSILGAGTYAWFTTQARSRNVITMGDVDISIVEQQMVNGKIEEYTDLPIDIMPSMSVSKIVSVRSDEEPAYIRVQYGVRITDPAGTETVLDAGQMNRILAFNGNSDEWIQKDGWWYYSQPLAQGSATQPIFESITFSGKHMGNEYQNCTLELLITAHAVQSANNPAPNGDVTSVKGWPNAN